MTKERRNARLALALVLVAFLIKMIATIAIEGHGPLAAADGVSEANSAFGAEHLARDGFFKSAGLPQYSSPLNLDSPSEAILKSPYYAHFLPGPDYVMALTYKLFGTSDNVFQWTRLIPLAMLFCAALLFLWAAERKVWRGYPWVAPFVALILLFAPGFRPWAVNLHGHAYSSSFILAGLALGMLSTEKKYRNGCLAAAFAIGFGSVYMLLTGTFVVFFAPLVGGLLVPSEDRRGWLPAAAVSFVTGFGLVSGFVAHFLQVVALFGFHDAWIDLTGTMANRKVIPGTSEPSRLQLLGQYSNHVYGFWGISSIAMALLGAVFGWLHRGSHRYRLQLFLAVFVAGLGSYGWIMVMKNHSIGHPHVNPRIFLLMYAAFLASLGAVAASRHQRQ